MSLHLSNYTPPQAFTSTLGPTSGFPAATPETGSLDGRRAKTDVAAHCTDNARHVLNRVMDAGQKHIVQPAQAAFPYVDKAAHDVGWALKGCPPLRMLTGIVSAVFKVATIIVNWGVMALENDKKSKRTDLDGMLDERSWPADIRSALKPVLLILKGVKALTDWIVDVLDPSARSEWSTDPATYLEQIVEKVITLSADDLKFAASKSLDLPLDCLITDISRAMAKLGDGHKRIFNHILIDRLLENLEASAEGDLKKFEQAKRDLLNLGETYEATPQSRRSVFLKGDAALASRLTGKPKAFDHTTSSDVFAAYAIAPPLIWDAIGAYATEDFVHL